jgi:hypothetical protein
MFSVRNAPNGELDQPLLGQRPVHTVGQLHSQLTELVGQDGQRVTDTVVLVRPRRHDFLLLRMRRDATHRISRVPTSTGLDRDDEAMRTGRGQSRAVTDGHPFNLPRHHCR